jgi:hypothetical protein
MNKHILITFIFLTIIFFVQLLSDNQSITITDKNGDTNHVSSGQTLEGEVQSIYTNTKFSNEVLFKDSEGNTIKTSTYNMGVKIGDTIRVTSSRSVRGLWLYPSEKTLEILN